MAAYLFCARISELVAYASPSDTTTARGPKGTDVRVDSYTIGPLEVNVAIFRISTAKRGGIQRLIALPLDREYEPWTESLYTYWKSCGDNHVFPFTRQHVWKHAKETFNGLYYQIDQYRIFENGKLKKIVDPHLRPFRLHALRHLRTAELVEYYGFDGIDLSIYGGWTLRSTIGVGSAVQRYAHLRWHKYFPKLLKRRQHGGSMDE
jgi:hypothetical protein